LEQKNNSSNTSNYNKSYSKTINNKTKQLLKLSQFEQETLKTLAFRTNIIQSNASPLEQDSLKTFNKMPIYQMFLWQ